MGLPKGGNPITILWYFLWETDRHALILPLNYLHLL